MIFMRLKISTFQDVKSGDPPMIIVTVTVNCNGCSQKNTKGEEIETVIHLDPQAAAASCQS